ncbi:MAG: hypothetical protein RL385_4331, partial [Pseudomonadota bacterium]
LIMGIAGANTLALPFVLVRRAKEACFILLGFLLWILGHLAVAVAAYRMRRKLE